MYRTRVAVILSVVLVGMLTLSAHSAMGGCHGGCVSPTGGASDSCDGNILTSAIKPMDRVTTGADPTTDLRLYSIRLGAGDQTESNILVGEATAFYVTSGAISFTIDPDAGAESVRVVTGPSAQPDIASGLVEIAAGGALFVDAQGQDVDIDYANAGSAEASLLIASAIPCGPETVPPTPDIDAEPGVATPGTEVKT